MTLGPALRRRLHWLPGALGAVGPFLLCGSVGCAPPALKDAGLGPSDVIVGLTVSPESVAVFAGDQSSFQASGRTTDGSLIVNPSVSWRATGGSITSRGQYRAGGAPGSFRVVVTDQAGRIADTAVVTVVRRPLRYHADARHFLIGAAAGIGALRSDAGYPSTLAREYNSVVAENAMKVDALHPAAGQYTFEEADQLVAFAAANHMVVHGHTLVWYTSLPTWLSQGSFTNTQIAGILKEYVTTVVTHFRGQVSSWDVVNEPIADAGGLLRPSIWLTSMGSGYIDSAFVWAHAADPAASLYVNDYGIEGINPKSNALLTLVRDLKARGVPVNGVGLQSHLTTAPPTDLQQNLARFAAAGLDTRISEMDVRIPNAADSTELARQATVYRTALDACLRTPRCTGLTTWGFTDRYSWIPEAFPGLGRALPMDSNLNPKPAYNALLEGLQDE